MLVKKDDTVSILVGDEGTVSPQNMSEIDIALIEHNLSLSYEKRLEEHQSALDLVLELKIAGEQLRSARDEARPQ